MDKKIEDVVARLQGVIDNTKLFNNAHNAVVDAITALQSEAQEIERLRNPWVPIADIPEEWKDGRSVILLIGQDCPSLMPHDEPRYIGYWSDSEEGSGWWKYTRTTGASDFVTHAMLPPTPPKDT